MIDKPSYYGIIPATIRYDSNLSNSQKIFFSEITALSNKDGYCWASNSYFAKLYNVDSSTISRWVKGLADNNYISVKYEKDGKQVKKRIIIPRVDPMQGVLQKSQGGIENMQGGYCKKRKGNSTSNNNTSKNNSAPARNKSPLSYSVEETDLASIEDIKNSKSHRELLVKCWIPYIRYHGKSITLYQQEVMIDEKSKWDLDVLKRSIIHSIGEGWKTIVKPDDEVNSGGQYGNVIDINEYNGD
jgi:hypothetical protein